MGWLTTLRTNTHQLLADYVAANPTKLRAAYKVRPASFPETPCAYVGDIIIDFLHTSGVRMGQPSTTVEIILVDNLTDNEEAVVNLDDVADELIEDLTAAPHLFGSNTVQEPIRSEPIAQSVDEVPYHGQRITLGRINVAEGRI